MPSWCALSLPGRPYTCYPPLTLPVRASRRDRAQPRAWPQATRATRRRRAGAHRACQAWPASCHPEALRRWRDRRRAREAEAVEVLRALAQSACIGLAGRRRLLRPACQASHTCGLSTSQPCARAGQSTEGSKGSFESGRTSRCATSDAPSGSSAKRRLHAADMRSPPAPPSQTRRSWAAAAMAPPRAPPRGPCAGLGCNLCRWCFGPLAVSHEHGEDGCSSRQKPSLADWTRYAATQPELCVRRATRTAADSSAAEAPLRGRKQTDRSTEEQAAYRAAYKRWHASEAKRLDAEASAVLAERVGVRVFVTFINVFGTDRDAKLGPDGAGSAQTGDFWRF